MDEKPFTICGVIAAGWSLAGLLLLLGFAIWRLSLYTIESLHMPMNWMHWTVFIGFTVFMAHSEGYKGFQKKFSPRFAARTKYLLANSTVTQCIFAPLFSMGFFHAPKKRIVASICLTIMIVVFIFLFQYIPQPWKGLLDAGVVIGLIWGMISTILFCTKAFSNAEYNWDAEILNIHSKS
ncbi:MAG: hypothetical protein OXC41_03300 [Gammaproteobacteria bacterium]|nr:hypothetical protein [Gammaproteobacteria bacterium]